MKSFIINPRNDEEIRNDIATDSSTVNGININDININDIEENIKDINTDKVKKKDENNSIEYYLFDVESYNNNKKNEENFLDLSSIRSSYLCDNKKKKAKKKKSSYLKKQLKIYKKKYKILPEHNIDQDTNYEESVKNENSKDYKIYELRDIKEDKDTNDYITSKTKDIYGMKKDVYVNVIKFIILISSIFSFGSFSTTITKYIIFVKKFNYTQIVTLFEFLIMYIILRIVIFFTKMKCSTNLTRKEYIKYIISISALLGLSVVTGNSAYSYLEIPIISVIKSSSLILIYFLSIRFGLKEFKLSLLCSILTILTGVIMSITSLKIDSLFGIFLLIISVISSSFKWVFTNVLLRSTSMKPHIILLHIYQVAMCII
ncbi:triose or hexose phosphate/phosphate translocator, putative, partial [Plasmodium reichenowi]